jgi:hypothetical protein
MIQNNVKSALMKTFLLTIALGTASLIAQEPAPLANIPAEMATAANAFLASLDENQAKNAKFPFAADQRENWGFVPRERKGVAMEELDEKQIALARALLKTALSDPGLKKVDVIMALEAFLGEIEKRPDFRNPKAYFTSVFGEPSATAHGHGASRDTTSRSITLS